MAKDDGTQVGPGAQPPEGPRYSRSLKNGIAMLESFTAGRPVAGVADLADALGMQRSTTHRYASTLHALGYLEQDEHRKYRLSRLAFEPGMAAVETVRRAVPAGAVLEELRAATSCTVSMAVLDRTRAIYIHRLHSHRAGQHAVDGERRVGACLPLHCSAAGKALLAELPAERLAALAPELDLARHGPNSISGKRRLLAELDGVRQSGIALSDEELAPGERSIAVAVPAPGEQHARIALEVSAPASQRTIQRLASDASPLLRAAAAEIAAHRRPIAEWRPRRHGGR